MYYNQSHNERRSDRNFLIYNVRTHHNSVKNWILLIKNFYLKKFAKSSE